jgi:hypothetical protein
MDARKDLPLLVIPNRHDEDGNEPPRFDTTRQNYYYGYFVDGSGDQFVFVFDPETGLAELRCGDAGWSVSHAVVDGWVETLMIGPDVAAWLCGCWRSATGQAPMLELDDDGNDLLTASSRVENLN